MPLSRFLAAAALALASAACVSSQPNAPSSANLVIEVTPIPVLVGLRCAAGGVPPCFVSLDPTVTLRETGGVGGRLESLEVTVRDAATGVESRLTLGRDWIVGQAGTDRIEANGSRAFRPVIADYPIAGTRPNFTLALAARFVDDRNHTLTPSVVIAVIT